MDTQIWKCESIIKHILLVGKYDGKIDDERMLLNFFNGNLYIATEIKIRIIYIIRSNLTRLYKIREYDFF